MTEVPGEPNTHLPVDHEEEFTRTYRELRPIVYRFVLVQYCRFNADAADEIVSDVFAKAWGHWAGIRLIPNLVPWFLTTAKYAAIDYWRKKKKDTPVELKEGDIVLVSHVTDAEVRLELLDSLTAMKSLPERMREALAQWCAGWTQHEIAEAMSLQENTISDYLKKARDRVARSVGRSRSSTRGRHRVTRKEPPHRENRPDREDQ